MRGLFVISQILLVVAEMLGMFVIAGGSKTTMPTGISGTTILLMAIFEALMFAIYLLFGGEHRVKYLAIVIVGAATVGVAAGFLASLFGSQYLWPWLIGTSVICLPISVCILEMAIQDNQSLLKN